MHLSVSELRRFQNARFNYKKKNLEIYYFSIFKKSVEKLKFR